jgi:hypothetical protein
MSDRIDGLHGRMPVEEPLDPIPGEIAADKEGDQGRRHAAEEADRQSPPSISHGHREGQRNAGDEQDRADHIGNADDHDPHRAEALRPLAETLQPFLHGQQEPGDDERDESEHGCGSEPDELSFVGGRWQGRDFPVGGGQTLDLPGRSETGILMAVSIRLPLPLNEWRLR